MLLGLRSLFEGVPAPQPEPEEERNRGGRYFPDRRKPKEETLQAKRLRSLGYGVIQAAADAAIESAKAEATATARSLAEVKRIAEAKLIDDEEALVVILASIR